MKQFIISVVVLFILSLGLGFAVHGAILKSDYDLLPNLMRTEAGQARHFPAMLLAHLFIATGLTAIYRRGREVGKGWMGQGVRFGILMVIVSSIPTYLIYYAVEPMPLTLMCKQIVFDSIATLILGIAAAGLNKPSA
jgi:hypothetical protein